MTEQPTEQPAPGNNLPETNHSLRYADYSSRLFATTLDMLLVFVLIMPAAMQVQQQFTVTQAQLTPEMPLNEALAQLIASGQLQLMIASNLLYTFSFIVLTFICWMLFASSPGKLLLGIRIVRAQDGEEPGTLRLLVRAIGYLLSGLPLMIGFLWVLGNRRKRGWHDYLAGTVVILDRRRDYWFAAKAFFWLRDAIRNHLRNRK